MIRKFISLLFLLMFSSLLSQTFITIDQDTHEFVEDVHYVLYHHQKVVFTGVCPQDKATEIRQDIEYDSIRFSRIDYHSLGLLKKDIEPTVLLSKKTLHLDEVILSSKNNHEIVLGETQRFVKNQQKPLSKEFYFGIMMVNEQKETLQINQVVFYVSKVFHQTLYQINVYEMDETKVKSGNQFALIGKLINVTDTLSLNRKTEGKITINLPDELILPPQKKVFVSIQLIAYQNEKGEIIEPPVKQRTELKFQLSKRNHFYSKTIDFITKQSSSDLININLMIKYDFAHQFFKKPHKSILVSPAILLIGKNMD